MQLYKNLSGESGVYAFEIAMDHIKVRFQETIKIYRYSYYKAGMTHVDELKRLALIGRGLNSYIVRNIRLLYD
jgi:hypothetical protein